MNIATENVRLRVVSDKVRLPNVSEPVPQGEYDGYIDWQTKEDGKPYKIAVQLMIDREGLVRMGRPDGIRSMDREVLRYLDSGDILRVD
jgi:hypothetical protein